MRGQFRAPAKVDFLSFGLHFNRNVARNQRIKNNVTHGQKSVAIYTTGVLLPQVVILKKLRCNLNFLAPLKAQNAYKIITIS
jgi:hypothetical protein